MVMDVDMKTLLLLWIIASTSSAADTDDIKVWCVDDTVMKKLDLVKNIDRDDLCKSTIISGTPWSEKEDITPAKPEDLKIKARTYRTNEDNSSRQIAVFISWRQKLVDIPAKEKGYYLELNFINPPGQHKQYKMTWDDTLRRVLDNSTSHYVEFNFIYCSRVEGSYHIRPGDKYRFKIQGLPMYQENMSPQTVAQSFSVPGCNRRSKDNKEIRKSEFCRSRNRKRNRKPKPSKSEKPNNSVVTEPMKLKSGVTDGIPVEEFDSTNIVFIVLGAVIISLVVAGLTFCLCQKRLTTFIMGKKNVAKRHILIISSTEEMYSQSINMLLKILVKMENTKITCNLWQKNDIGEHGIVKWVTKNTTDADFVVFIVGNKREIETDYHIENGLSGEIEKYQVGKSLKTAESIINSSKCANSHKKFMVVDLCDHVKKEELPLFKHYRLPVDFKKFTTHVIGEKEQVSSKDKVIFSKLLSNLHAESNSRVTNGEVDDLIESDNAHLPGQNDIDSPPLLSIKIGEEPSLSLNIEGGPISYTDDGPPSCESNQSHEYKTTDFNNPEEANRYLRTGARPKYKC